MTEFWYCIMSGGDGSVYLDFYEDEMLAWWAYENDSEPFAEGAVDCVSVTSDSPVNLLNTITTRIGYFLGLYDDDCMDKNRREETKRFLKEFFPGGLPTFIVKTVDDPIYYHVYIENDDRLHRKSFSYEYGRWVPTTEEGRQRLEDRLNSLYREIMDE